MSRASNYAALRAIVRSLNSKAIAAGYEPMSEATIDEAVRTLAIDSAAFDFIDDQEARLGLRVADERQDLSLLYMRQGFPREIPLPAAAPKGK